jgi:hypothetical protein
MPAVTATDRCCVESGCLADFKIRFVICHAGECTAGRRRREGGLPEQVGVVGKSPPPCLQKLPPIDVALNLGV